MISTQFIQQLKYLDHIAIFLSTFEKTQRRKNSNKTWLKKKNSVNFAFKTQSTAGLSLLLN